VAHSGQYLLPQYISAFVVASNIRVFLPGLGSWNYSDYDSEKTDVINILMKYSYAKVLFGGIGPFNFGVRTSGNNNFNIRRKDGGLLISIPGGQVIAYILNTISKFPENQAGPLLAPLECNKQSSKSSHRRKRSVPNKITTSHSVRKLAQSLFSDEVKVQTAMETEETPTDDGGIEAQSPNYGTFLSKEDHTE